MKGEKLNMEFGNNLLLKLRRLLQISLAIRSYNDGSRKCDWLRGGCYLRSYYKRRMKIKIK